MQCKTGSQLTRVGAAQPECKEYLHLDLSGHFSADMSLYTLQPPACRITMQNQVGCLCANGTFEDIDRSCAPCADGSAAVHYKTPEKGITRFCIPDGSRVSPLQGNKSCGNYDADVKFCPCQGGQVATADGECAAFSEPSKFSQECAPGYWYRDAEERAYCLKSSKTPLDQIERSYDNNFGSLSTYLGAAAAALLVAMLIMVLLLIKECGKKSAYKAEAAR